ncbi:MAG TPA: glycerate kinase [Melioribacteraceae bacterium]|nr:glycerate kinase [Melioribacteraceae bacterium]
MKTILIAPNSFKNCFDSIEVTELISRFLLKKNPQLKKKFKILKRPISDGGNGFLDVCKIYFNLELDNYNVTTFNGCNKHVPVGFNFENRIAYFGVSDLIGDKVLSNGKYGLNPYVYNSASVGQLLKKLDLINKRRKLFDKVIIGVGGTITSDLGLGIMSCFNFKIKRNGEYLPIYPNRYLYAQKTEYEKPDLTYNMEIVTDVSNPLVGKDGANYSFGFQKGIKRRHLQFFELGFKNILNLLNVENIENYNGSGGGVAFALQYFFGANTISSQQFIMDLLKIKEIKADYVITGEGSFDEQTLLKKGPKIIIDYAKKYKANKVFVISGKTSTLKDDDIFVYNIQDYFMTQEESINKAKVGLEKIVELISTEIIKDSNGK